MFPSDDPALDDESRARIERAWADAEQAYAETTTGPPVWVFGETPAPIRFVLTIATVAIREYCTNARNHQWPAATLRAGTKRFLARLIRETYREKQGDHVTRAVFERRVYNELGTDPCWFELQETIRACSQHQPAAATATPPAEPPAYEPATLGEWLRAQRRKRRLSIGQLAAKLNEDASMIGRHERHELRPGDDWRGIYEKFYEVPIPDQLFENWARRTSNSTPSRRRRHSTRTALKRSR